MSVLGRLRLGSQQRFDLPDALSFDSYVASDFKAIIQTFTGNLPYILKGFEIIDAKDCINTTSVSIKIAESIVFDPTSTAGSFYFGLPEGDPLSAPLSPDLRLGTSGSDVVNYIYATLTTINGGADSRAFWDGDLNGGNGGEFNQEVDTESILTVQIGVSVSSFPDGTIPIAKVKTNTSGIIEIVDCRNLLFRLGTGGLTPNPYYTYDFKDLPSSEYARSEPPSSITGSSQPSPFFGGDKNLFTMKEWMDVVMTKLLEISGTPYWYKSNSGVSISNIFSDALCSNIKSKGKWDCDINTPGLVTWTEDIVYRKLNDPRDIIIRAGNKILNNNEVLYINFIRDEQINSINTPVSFYYNQNYINGAIGSFEYLKVGDWVKNINDPDNLYLRVEFFYEGLNGVGAITSNPALAKSIKLSGMYQGISATSYAVYTKGEYLAADLSVSLRTDPNLLLMGDNFFWLANRSDTVQSLSITPILLAGSIGEADGESAIITTTTNHNLNNGDRIIISSADEYNGTYIVVIEDGTHIRIPTPNTASKPTITISCALVGTNIVESIGGFDLESATNGFETNQKVIIYNTLTGYDGQYYINVFNNTGFNIPITATQATLPPYSSSTQEGIGGRVSCAKIQLRTEFGSVRLIQGESININEPDTKNIMRFIGMSSLAEGSPDYLRQLNGYNTLKGYTNYNCDSDDNLTTRVAKLSSMMADRVQDRNIKILGENTFRNKTTTAPYQQLILNNNDTAGFIIEIPGSSRTSVQILSNIVLNENEAFCFTINREGSTTTTSIVSLLTAYEQQENRFILFYRLQNDTTIYTWDGHPILNNTSWTSNSYENVQNRNIFIIDRSGVQFNISDVFSYRTPNIDGILIKIPGSTNDNIINTTAISNLSDITRTLTDNDAVWIRINRKKEKIFNNISINPLTPDSDTNGLLYITPIANVPKDQDVFVIYHFENGVFLTLHHEKPIGSIYDEFFDASATSAGNPITLPLDTRRFNEQQFYIVGSGQLEVFLNGQKLRIDIDYSEVGVLFSSSNSIIILQDLVDGDVLEFRIGSEGGVFYSSLPSTIATLQDGYDYGNEIITTSGRPVRISGPIGEKLLEVDGDIEVSGVIDPKGITFTPQISNPLGMSLNGLWVNASGELIHERPGEAVTPVNITDRILNSIGGMSDPTTTAGDLIYKNPSNSTTRLPIGNLGQVLSVTGINTVAWSNPISVSQEIFLTNNTGSVLNPLEILRVDNTGGVNYINPSMEAEALGVIGISIGTANDGDPISICTAGKIENISGGWNFGDLLFLSKVGGLTNIKPDIGIGGFVSGDFVIKIGVVSKNMTNPVNKDLMLAIQIMGQL